MISGRTLDVWLAVRDAGARTPHEIAVLVGGDGGGTQIGPAIHVLMRAGWLVRVGRWRYCNARTAQSMIGATR